MGSTKETLLDPKKDKLGYALVLIAGFVLLILKMTERSHSSK